MHARTVAGEGGEGVDGLDLVHLVDLADVQLDDGRLRRLVRLALCFCFWGGGGRMGGR